MRVIGSGLVSGIAVVLLVIVHPGSYAGASTSPADAFVALVIDCIYATECVAGDVNDDGRVSAADVVAAVEASLPDATFTPTDTAMATPTDSPTPTHTSTPSLTVTPTASGTPTSTGTATETGSATVTPTETATPSITQSPTMTPTASRTPTNTPTTPATRTSSPTRTPTRTVSPSPSRTPTRTASMSPTSTPTRSPTASATVTASPTITPTPSPTVPQTLDGDASAAAAIAAVFRDFPLLLADGIAASGCPLGGEATRLCNELGVPREINATFEQCVIPAAGGSLVIDGMLRLTGEAGSCPNILLGAVTEAVELTLIYRDPNDVTQRAVSADLVATVNEHRGLESACFFTGVTATVGGTIQTLAEAGMGVDVELDDVEIDADVSARTVECLPVSDTRMLSGKAIFTDRPAGRTYPVTFDSYTIARNDPDGIVQVEQSGTVSGPCFGGQSTVTTTALLFLPPPDPCPASGTVMVENAGNPTRTLTYENGMVSVDEDGDGEVDDSYPSCLSGPACN